MAAQGGLVAWAIYGSRGVLDRWFLWSLGGFVLTIAFTGTFRDLMHDWVISLGGGGRIIYGVIVAFAFSWPGFVEGHRVMPEGFAVALPLIAFISARETIVRVFIGYTILGFAMAALGDTPPSLSLTLAVTFTTIFSITATHFAFTGADFGLRGWWAIGKIAQTSAIYFFPTALVAAATFLFWPEFVPDAPAAAGQAQQSTASRVAAMNPDQLGEALFRLALWLAMLLASLALLYYLRRRLGRRSAPLDVPKVFGTDVSELEIEKMEVAAPGPTLGGRRGQIVELWQRWQLEYEARGLGRSSSETADEMARRVRAGEQWDGSSKEALTGMLERAHYGEAEPTDEEVAQMQRTVKEEMRD